jgi:hypothetical protein
MVVWSREFEVGGKTPLVQDSLSECAQSVRTSQMVQLTEYKCSGCPIPPSSRDLFLFLQPYSTPSAAQCCGIDYHLRIPYPIND